MIVADPVIADRYAQALISVAKKQGAVANLVEESEETLPLFASGTKLSRFLESPQIPAITKQQVLDKALKGRIHELFHQLLSLLVRKGRIDYIRPVLEQFKLLAERDQGIFEADVQTATPLDGPQRETLQSALENYTKARLRINYEVDPALIGGVRFQYGDVLIDDSVKGKLYRLRQRLETAAR